MTHRGPFQPLPFCDPVHGAGEGEEKKEAVSMVAVSESLARTRLMNSELCCCLFQQQGKGGKAKQNSPALVFNPSLIFTL